MKIVHTLHRVKKFLTADLWDLDLNALSLLKKITFGSLRVCYIVVRGFYRNNWALHAAALTYITLMSLVPLLALMFSMAKGFGAGQKLQELMAQQLAQMPENVQQYIQQMMTYVENTNFGVVGAVGLVLLLYAVMGTLGKIESSFNTIWGIHEQRTFLRKFTDYISVILVVPILILAATSINATLNSSSFMMLIQEKIPHFTSLYKETGRLTGILFIWTAFSFIYIFIPNTRVRIGPAIAAGVLAGTLWQLMQWTYIHLQMLISNYNAVYGTFASVPIFMVWLFVCWEIVLLGCEVCFAVQNVKTYEHESQALKANQATRELLALSLMKEVGRTFESADGAWSPTQFSQRHHIPIRLVRDVVHQLSESKIVYCVDNAEDQYVPAHSLESIHVKDILLALRGEPEKNIIKKFPANSFSEELSLKKLIEKK